MDSGSVKGRAKVQGSVTFKSGGAYAYHGTAAELRAALRGAVGATFSGLHLGTGAKVTGFHTARKCHNKPQPPVIGVLYW